MNVLFITDPDPDYGADYLFDGLHQATHGRVTDFPMKRTLHLGAIGRGAMEQRFDCDLYWPELEPFSKEMYRDGMFDLIVIPTLRSGAARTIRGLRALDETIWARTPKIGYDAEDHNFNVRDAWEQECGPLAAFFKRECPRARVGSGVPLWAEAMPFGYPEYRSINPALLGGDGRAGIVFYGAYIWEWSHQRGMRAKLRDELQAALQPAHLDLHVTDDAKKRLSLTEYHARQRRALASVVPAGQGYWTNRYWEAVADGCLVIAERPPGWLYVDPENFLEEGVEALYFSTPSEAVSCAAWAIANPTEAAAMAQLAMNKFRRSNTTTAMARRVIQAAGLEIP